MQNLGFDHSFGGLGTTETKVLVRGTESKQSIATKVHRMGWEAGHHPRGV